MIFMTKMKILGKRMKMKTKMKKLKENIERIKIKLFYFNFFLNK